MQRRTYTFKNNIKLTHEMRQDTMEHRLIAADGNSPWLPQRQLITYDIAGRYFAAINYPGLPYVFELLPSIETSLENVTVGG